MPLTMWFYNPQNDPSGVLNKVVALIDQPFCHCELQFSCGRAVSIYYNTTVAMRVRKFQNSAYTCLVVPCTPQQELKALRHAEALVDQRQTFSLMGMVQSYTRIGSCSPGSTFCSKLCVEIMQQADLLPVDVVASHVTPSGLYALLSNHAAPETRRAKSPNNGKAVAIDFK